MSEPQTEAAPPNLASDLRNLSFEFLEELAWQAASLWRSAAEAAFRGDSTAFSVHVRQARLTTFTVVQAMEKVVGKGGAS